MKKIIFALSVIWLFVRETCVSKEELEFERNPNLELFLSNTLKKVIFFTFYTTFYPRWSS